MTPMFIVLEALDGVGKSTAARALAAELGGVAMNTPGDQLRGVSEAVLRGLGEQQAARCLYYAASVVARGAEARRAVDGGVPVVMDRYWLSTIAYARARGVTAALDGVEALVPAPDLTVMLVLDEDERRRRLQGRGLTDADRETIDGGFRDRVVAEMMSEERSRGLRPSLVVDVTGLDPGGVVARLIAEIGVVGRGLSGPAVGPLPGG
jgi:dTMP kinase